MKCIGKSVTGEEEEECGIAIGGSSSASCCKPMQHAKKSVRSLLREKPWLCRRSAEREREVLFGSFVKCLAAFDK